MVAAGSWTSRQPYDSESTSAGDTAKGGGKAASEWEELEKLSKDELIIELVRQRWLYKDLRLQLRYMSEEEGQYAGAPGQVPSKEWQRKIADYVFPNVKDGGYEDLMTWGVDEEVGEALFNEYFDENGKRRA